MTPKICVEIMSELLYFLPRKNVPRIYKDLQKHTKCTKILQGFKKMYKDGENLFPT